MDTIDSQPVFAYTQSQVSSGNRNVVCILERKSNEFSASSRWKQPGANEDRAAQPRHTQPREPVAEKGRKRAKPPL